MNATKYLPTKCTWWTYQTYEKVPKNIWKKKNHIWLFILITLIIIQRYSENENRLYVDVNSTSGTSILMASSEDLLMCQSFVIQILSNIQHSNCRIFSNR